MTIAIAIAIGQCPQNYWPETAASTAESCSAEACGQVRRVAEKFALLASAGLLAIQAKVLDWPTQSVEASCLSQLNQMRCLLHTPFTHSLSQATE